MYAPTPDGEVRILNHIRLDRDYNNTAYFATQSAQESYFMSHGPSGLVFTDCMYIRQTRRLRVPVSADTLCGCNYLMYKNQQYVNKWFYAFIDQVYYLNDNCSEIEFTIDVMQTYFPECLIPDCWIERNHIPKAADIVGANRINESLDIGDYEIESTVRPSDLATDFSVVMFSTFDPADYSKSGGSLNDGMYSALKRTVIGRVQLTQTASGTTNATWVQDPRPIIEDIVQNHADLVDGVVALILTPTYFENNASKLFNVTRPIAYSGYTVKNNKLFTAPYLVLYVTSGSAVGKFYQFEEFLATNGAIAQFVILSDKAPAQSTILAPANYKCDLRGTGVSDLNYSEMMIDTGFPQCAWVSDAFKTYLAQNQTNIGVTAGMGALQIVGGVITTVATEGAGAALGAGMIMSGIGTIMGHVSDMQDKSKRPPEAHGNITGTALYLAGEKTFRAYVMRPRTEYLKVIDDFWEKFGYPIKAIGTPNFNARSHWTYIKTADVAVNPFGAACGDADDIKKIADILNKGITFWVHEYEIGDYSLSNT